MRFLHKIEIMRKLAGGNFDGKLFREELFLEGLQIPSRNHDYPPSYSNLDNFGCVSVSYLDSS